MPKFFLLLILILNTACTTPQVQKSAENLTRPELSPAAVMADGYQLPVSVWNSNEYPAAIILALHGFND